MVSPALHQNPVEALNSEHNGRADALSMPKHTLICAMWFSLIWRLSKQIQLTRSQHWFRSQFRGQAIIRTKGEKVHVAIYAPPVSLCYCNFTAIKRRPSNRKWQIKLKVWARYKFAMSMRVHNLSPLDIISNILSMILLSGKWADERLWT